MCLSVSDLCVFVDQHVIHKREGLYVFMCVPVYKSKMSLSLTFKLIIAITFSNSEQSARYVWGSEPLPNWKLPSGSLSTQAPPLLFLLPLLISSTQLCGIDSNHEVELDPFNSFTFQCGVSTLFPMLQLHLKHWTG